MNDSIDDQVARFGSMDIYLFDQLQKRRITKHARILDAGCGSGRNLTYFHRQGNPVVGVDASASAIASATDASRALRAEGDHAQFLCADLKKLPLPDDSFDLVICNAVLHFAADRDEWNAIVRELWRVLAKGGLWFSRLSTSITMEGKLTPMADGRSQLPGNGPQWMLVGLDDLLELSADLGAELVDPIKTTNVQGMRSMTTWVLRKAN